MAKRKRSTGSSTSMDAVRSALKSQHRAALAMLRLTIQRCPDRLWISRRGHANPFWRIAYHTLYYTHLYLQPNNRVFRPWKHDQPGIHRMDTPMAGGRPYTKDEVLAYWAICEAMVDDIDDLDLSAPRSGFSWYPMPKLEHQLVNIRHIQYHQGQLADRLRAATGTGIGWTGAGRKSRRAS